MQFIEMSGKTLQRVVQDDELHPRDSPNSASPRRASSASTARATSKSAAATAGTSSAACWAGSRNRLKRRNGPRLGVAVDRGEFGTPVVNATAYPRISQ